MIKRGSRHHSFLLALRRASRETLVLPLALRDVHIAQGELLELLEWPRQVPGRSPPFASHVATCQDLRRCCAMSSASSSEVSKPGEGSASRETHPCPQPWCPLLGLLLSHRRPFVHASPRRASQSDWPSGRALWSTA